MDKIFTEHTTQGKNKAQFSWSVSRHKTFNGCKRQYYLNYYVARNAHKSPYKVVKRVRELKNRKILAFWKGTVIHEMIAGILKARRARIEFLNIEFEYKTARDRFIEGLEEIAPKASFGFGAPPLQKFIDEAVEEFDTIMENLRNSEIYNWLLTLRAEEVLEIDPPFNNFMFNGTKVYAIPDVLARVDGIYYIVDWKTGKIPSMKNQASIYKLYVAHKYDADPDNIKIKVGGLGEGRDTYAHTMSLEETEEFIESSKGDMLDLMDERGLTRAEDFPLTDNTFRCRYCSFREICGR